MIALRNRVLRSTLLIASVVLLTSCDVLGLVIGPSTSRSELERQRAKWARQNVATYRLTYHRDCFCGSAFTTPTEIEVSGGAITRAEYSDRDDPIPGYVQVDLPTVESLFAIIANAIDREADMLEVTYDPLRGYPRRIAIDYRFNIADDEVTHSVSAFAIIITPVGP